MKRTELVRKERDLKKSMKKEERVFNSESSDRSVGDFIDELHSYFFYDENKIYNIEIDERIMDLLEEMKEELPEKQWENVLKKAVRKTKVAQKDEAVSLMKDLAEI